MARVPVHVFQQLERSFKFNVVQEFLNEFLEHHYPRLRIPEELQNVHEATSLEQVLNNSQRADLLSKKLFIVGQ